MPRDDQPTHPSHRPPADTARGDAGPLIAIKTQRTLAKAGVLVALGVLVWTGMQRPRRRYMPLHTWTGMALIGVTLWHWSLYLPRPEKRARSPRPASAATSHAAASARTAEG
jgi:hypothetical protein